MSMKYEMTLRIQKTLTHFAIGFFFFLTACPTVTQPGALIQEIIGCQTRKLFSKVDVSIRSKAMQVSIFYAPNLRF